MINNDDSLSSENKSQPEEVKSDFRSCENNSAKQESEQLEPEDFDFGDSEEGNNRSSSVVSQDGFVMRDMRNSNRPHSVR